MNLRRGSPGQEPGRVRLIDALENEGDQGEDTEETSQFGCHLVASLATGHTSKTWRASHKVASVSTEDGKCLKHPVVVHFDSGASGGNYVSEAFVSKMESCRRRSSPTDQRFHMG
jgi:hypothetical protein